mmetsp:Transcript_24296/g.36445  ORF Transcript_24296/g.36445 Transcript_24296/m.36445 type:complete len:183 (-) Transcript_24296:38-586(-)
MSYYDIDDALVEEEPVVSLFHIDALDLGYLDPNSAEEDLKKGTRVQIPLWLANTLAKRQMATIQTPDFMNKKFEQDFLADPVAMDLKKKAPMLYAIGQRVSELFGDAEMSNMLLKGLAARYREIIGRSSVWRSHTYGPFVSKLANLEETLLNCKQEAERALYKWTTGEHKSSSKSRKRKHVS